MNHHDHVALLKGASIKGAWADLGSGEGAFTLALADLGGKDIEIYSMDKDKDALDFQKATFQQVFPKTHVHYIVADFTKNFFLPHLDGILMANSLHFVEDKKTLLKRLVEYIHPGGKLILVEYNADVGNQWVPYPLSFESFKKLAADLGLSAPTLLHTVPSQFLKEIYSAVVTI